MRAVITLDIAKTNVRLPAGRARAEEMLLSEYLRLIRPRITALPVDSSRTVENLLASGSLQPSIVEEMAYAAQRIPPALSTDLASLQAIRIIDLRALLPRLTTHTEAKEAPRTLFPVPESEYTGIIIMANETLKAHGKKTTEKAVPALFPKIFDSDMNLIYSRDMVKPDEKAISIVTYTTAAKVFRNTPSGVDDSLKSVVGERPLRIIAEEVFGIRPTDLVISAEDALLIISSAANRRLLHEGRVAFVLADDVLKY